MTFSSLPLPGLRLIQPRQFSDLRGSFVKTFQQDLLLQNGIDFTPREEYFSISEAGVLRGMHFQAPPAAYGKMVYCLRGRIHDVALDLREGSPTYGQIWSGELDDKTRAILYLPPGIAHGFYSPEGGGIVVYSVSETHQPALDLGIRWDSFGHNWPCQNPILSERDRKFPLLAEFSTPFRYP
jgi:dTDP-4-dehydrorhamnose 3,5-epimerase